MANPTPFDLAFSRSALLAAWEHVRARAAGPGIDRVTVRAFAAQATADLELLYTTLRDGVWQPRPAIRICLANDPDRPIAVSTVRDRIVHRALSRTLTDAWEQHAADQCWSFRRGRSVQDALRIAGAAIRHGQRAWGRSDFRQFFERIPHDVLLQQIDGLWNDERLRRILERCLKAGALRGPATVLDAEGLPQGSALSPVLSNIYLHSFDKACEELPGTILRYADDLLVLANTPQDVAASLEAMQSLASDLQLSLNARKTRQGSLHDELVFLGSCFDANGQTSPVAGQRALQARMANLFPHRLDEALGTLAIWEEWHGPLDASIARDLPMIGVVLTRLLAPHAPPTTTRAREAILRTLARQRAGAASDARTEHAECARTMVPLWLQALDLITPAKNTTTRLADDRPCPAADTLRDLLERALLRDARLMLTNATAPEQEALGALLGLPPETTPANTWTHKDWCQAFLACGQGVRARATLALVQEDEMRTRGAIHATTLHRDPAACLDLLAQRLGSLSLHASGEDARGHRQFSREVPWTADAIQDHLEGRAHLGISIVPRRRMTSVLLFVLKPPRPPDPGQVEPGSTESMLAAVRHATEEILERAAAIARTLVHGLHDKGLHPLLERCGDGRWRIWLFLDAPLAVTRAERSLALLARSTVSLPSDFRLHWQPRSHVGRRTTGPVEALPLGQCPRTGAWSVLMDRWLEPVVAPWQALEEHPRTPIRALLSLQEDVTTTVAAVPKDRTHALLDDLKRHPRATSILEGCGVLRSIVARAATLGSLETLERASLHETLGHLTDQEAAHALHRILSEVRATTPDQVRQRLRRLPPHPLSCARLRERHPGHQATCTACLARCAARPGDRARSQRTEDALVTDPWRTAHYPSPLLHAHGVAGFSFLTRDGLYITPRTQQVRARAGLPPLTGAATPRVDRAALPTSNRGDGTSLAERTAAPHALPPNVTACDPAPCTATAPSALTRPPSLHDRTADAPMPHQPPTCPASLPGPAASPASTAPQAPWTPTAPAPRPAPPAPGTGTPTRSTPPAADRSIGPDAAEPPDTASRLGLADAGPDAATDGILLLDAPPQAPTEHRETTQPASTPRRHDPPTGSRALHPPPPDAHPRATMVCQPPTNPQSPYPRPPLPPAPARSHGRTPPLSRQPIAPAATAPDAPQPANIKHTEPSPTVPALADAAPDHPTIHDNGPPPTTATMAPDAPSSTTPPDTPRAHTPLDALLARHLEARRDVVQTRDALIAHFERHHTHRIRLATGWLTYHPGPSPRFTLDLD